MLPTATLEFLDKLRVIDGIIDGNGNALIKNGQINPEIASRINADTTIIMFDDFFDPSNFKNNE